MSPIYSSSGDAHRFEAPFTPCPAGVYSAVCVDVIDEGMKENTYKNDDGSPKPPRQWVSLVWQVAKLMESGKRFSIRAWFTNSLYPGGKGNKSKLRTTLDSWGVEIPAEVDLNIEKYDLEQLIGKTCLLNVVHVKSQDGSKTYANLGSIMPLPDGMTPVAVDNYVRKMSTASGISAAREFAGADSDSGSDSDIPF